MTETLRVPMTVRAQGASVPMAVREAGQAVPFGENTEFRPQYNTDYDRLSNKPSINGVELQGNKTFEQLGEETITNVELQSIIDAQYNLIFGGG